MNELEQKQLMAICVLAASADGSQSEAERSQVQKIAEGLHQNPMLTAVYQEVLDQKLTLSSATEALRKSDSRSLAYEMAVSVCNADGVTAEDERRFLEELRRELRLDPVASQGVVVQAEALAQTAVTAQSPPKPSATADEDTERMILNCAMLTGALELLPDSVATMAIIPIQLRMVYRIGRNHGFELSRRHIQDFLATVGIGLTSQVVEGFARRLAGQLTGSIAGRLLGGVAGAATGSAFSFGTTYALGKLAEKYYGSGRSLTGEQLREVFCGLLQEGHSLQSRYTNQILDKSRQLDMSDLVPLVRGS